MATFHIRQDSAKRVPQQEKSGLQKYAKPQDEQQDPRLPLRCVTNAVCGVKRVGEEYTEARAKRESTHRNGETNPSLNLECLRLVGKENVPFIAEYFAEGGHYLPDDIICAIEYGADIWRYLCHLETDMQLPKPKYMTRQQDLNLEMRSVLVDWLVLVAEEYKVTERTIHLSVNYIDRFLSCMSVVREKLQLVGAAAMMLATKVEEVEILEPEEWVFLTGQAYSVQQITRMEQLLLKILRFEMNPPTAVAFVQQLCVALGLDKKTLYLAMYISELVLLEGDVYLQYLPSRLAAASIVLAQHMLRKKNPCYEKLKEFSGYDLEQLNPVISKQHRTYRDSPTKEQQAIQTKYKSEKYCKVAMITPRALNLEEFDD